MNVSQPTRWAIGLLLAALVGYVAINALIQREVQRQVAPLLERQRAPEPLPPTGARQLAPAAAPVVPPAPAYPAPGYSVPPPVSAPVLPRSQPAPVYTPPTPVWNNLWRDQMRQAEERQERQRQKCLEDRLSALERGKNTYGQPIMPGCF